jgi:hypothetical protein
MKFQIGNGSGGVKDTMLSRFGYKLWSKSPGYPAYVKWENLPFAVLRSPLSGVGLFTDTTSSFTTGQVIGYSFFKINSSGKFNIDYLETNIGSFINNSGAPNMNVVQTSTGLQLVANQNIPPGTELTVSYQAIINMFPNDVSVKQEIQYW